MAMVALLFVGTFFIPKLFIVAQIVFIIVLCITCIDAFVLFNNKVKIDVIRNCPKALSLSDNNSIELTIINQSPIELHITAFENLPEQLQLHNFSFQHLFKRSETKKFNYLIKPNERGLYLFQATYLFVSSKLNFVERRIIIHHSQSVACYPSVLQMKKAELLSKQRFQTFEGSKKQNRVGASYEFEQTKNYVSGDDYRHLNWKATSKLNRLMMNQYEDEKSQQVYFLIDKSRNMLMPFNGLSLMDYSINATLALANVVLKKQDKVGLITFSNLIHTKLKSERKANQLHKINEVLYNEKETELEADYELLYHTIRNYIHGRSMLFLFTNFESSYALQRVLPILRSINKLHLLVVVFFENTEISDFANQTATNLQTIYDTTIATTMLDEKRQVLKVLHQYGIQAIITKPEDLNIVSINKYLQLKLQRSL
jgi:uncharacterized protein (DUF58 family)